MKQNIIKQFYFLLLSPDQYVHLNPLTSYTNGVVASEV